MVDREVAVVEYIKLLKDFVKYLKSQEGDEPNQKEMIGFLEMLSEKSVALNALNETRQLYDEMQRLFNQAQYLKNIRFYFPDTNLAACKNIIKIII